MKKDITEMLTFEQKTALVIKGQEIEVNNDAPSILKVLSMMSEEKSGNKEVIEAYEVLFPEKSREKLSKLKINFKGIVTVVKEAIKLVVGAEEPGEE